MTAHCELRTSANHYKGLHRPTVKYPTGPQCVSGGLLHDIFSFSGNGWQRKLNNCKLKTGDDDCVNLSVAEYQIIEAPDWDDGAICDIKRDLAKTMVQRLFHWGPLAVICITLIIGTATTYVHLQWWPLTTVTSFLHLSLFLLFNYLTLINLSRSSFFGPGYAPYNWKPPRKFNNFMRMKIDYNIVEYVMALKCLVRITAQNVVAVFAKWIITAPG
ncbi:unnamed protein product [Acanthocheilonema viteae]|uniref:Uncharacterized protein n=1 Tax=Acanthocheilonema viteae TaxID=6277 RepID=A0A498SRH5_ACAVI|nr:unnamed protein product [Acanthocheilonema viteae]